MMLEEALEKIIAQQPKDRTPVWMVGEQLKDILRAEPELAELVLQDLDVSEMSIKDCEKKIKEFADKNKSGGFSCVIPSEAERIIREFYGLPERGVRLTAAPTTEASGKILDLADFF
ncbi:MAG: hypothetical protein EOM54_14470 [Clostridia bacterium]|nr:hypothetical protein [Clostridia bacterium]